MNILWYVSICMMFLSIAFAFSARAENRRLKSQQQKEPEEQIVVRRFRSIQV